MLDELIEKSKEEKKVGQYLPFRRYRAFYDRLYSCMFR